MRKDTEVVFNSSPMPNLPTVSVNVDPLFSRPLMKRMDVLYSLGYEEGLPSAD